MHIVIEESIHTATLALLDQSVDAVVIAYPDYAFEYGCAPYTHIHCRNQATVDAVLRHLPTAEVTGTEPDGTIVMLFNDAGYVAIEALYPLFTHTRADDLPLIEAFAALGTSEPLEFIGVIHIPATDRRMADAWMTDLLPAGFMEEVEAITTELTQRYLHSGSIRDAIGGMGYNADDVLAQVNGLLGIDAEAVLAHAADYTNQPAEKYDPLKDRPIFSRDQILSVRKLRPGREYILVTGPFQDREHVWFKHVETQWDGDWMVYDHINWEGVMSESRKHLGDCGIEPYFDGISGYWNDTNHTLRAPRRPKFVFRKENGKIVRRNNVVR